MEFGMQRGSHLGHIVSFQEQGDGSFDAGPLYLGLYDLWVPVRGGFEIHGDEIQKISFQAILENFRFVSVGVDFCLQPKTFHGSQEILESLLLRGFSSCDNDPIDKSDPVFNIFHKVFFTEGR